MSSYVSMRKIYRHLYLQVQEQQFTAIYSPCVEYLRSGNPGKSPVSSSLTLIWQTQPTPFPGNPTGLTLITFADKRLGHSAVAPLDFQGSDEHPYRHCGSGAVDSKTYLLVLVMSNVGIDNPH